jgi:glycosyltransferase involved in cell wall biosynthesis
VRAGEYRGPLLQWLPVLLFYGRAQAWLRARDFDALICHNLDVLPLGCRVRRRTSCRLIFDAHEPNYYALWPRPLRFMVRVIERLDRSLARRCDAVTVTNSYQVEKYTAAGARRVTLIGNYTRPALRTEALDEAKFARTETVFGRFGTLYPAVGLEPMLEAFGRLATERTDVRLVLGGRVVDAYRPDFDRACEGVRGNVEVIGPYAASRIPELYRRIHVSCLTYPKSDWFRNITPTKFFDSLANGVPVVMTDIGRLGRIIRETGCGIVVKDSDVEGIRAAMGRLAADRAGLRRMSRRALEVSRTRFNWETMRDRYVDLVRSL